MPIKYIPYVPDTVEGQAILNNITRTQRVLRYRDNDKVISKIMRGMPYYEVETVEIVTGNSMLLENSSLTTNYLPSNIVMRGECLSACAYLKEQGIKVDLVYIDPPFASGADYSKKVHLRRNPKLAEKLAAAEQEMDLEELKSFEEKMYGDIWQKEDYLNWMYENLMAIKSVMSDTASIYVHLDFNIAHYVKILLDEVFGEDNFKNEIIWCYSERGISKTYWNRKHDSIFFYAKSESWTFNFDEVRDEYSEESKKKFKYYDEEVDDYYQIRGKNIAGSPVQRADGLLPEDEITYMGLTYRQYMGAGMLPKDWWEISPVNKAANERTGYATQKPSELLERIIKASSDKGMVVADFFGGSGVTAKVAHDLGRTFIHVDIGINSIQTVRDRLIEAGASFKIVEIKDGVSLFRNPQQTMDKLATLIPGLQQQVAGIHTFWFGAIQDSQFGTIPVYVPNLIDGTEKIFDIPAANRIINEELQKLEINVQKAIVYYVDVDDRKKVEKFIRDNNATQTEIELRDLKSLLHHIVVEDIVTVSGQWLMLNESGEEVIIHDNKDLDTSLFLNKKAGDTVTIHNLSLKIIKYILTINNFISDRLLQKITEFNEKGSLQAIGKGKAFSPIEISEEGLELIEHISLDCEHSSGIWHSTTEIKIDKHGYVIKDGVKSKEFWDGSITSLQQPKRIKIRNISGDETIHLLGE